MKTPAIITENIVHDFPAGDEEMTRVLHGISITTYNGELTMLVGPSGCGKTTLLSIITSILTPTDGRVSVNGTEVTSLSNHEKVLFRRRNVGFIFQQYNLIPALTAAENAAVPMAADGMVLEQAAGRARTILQNLGMQGHTEKLPHQLSGGQQQRVAIARALVHDPKLIVCDEPTAALDAASGQAVMQQLKVIASDARRSVLVVTHDPRIFPFADRIFTMGDGMIEKEETHAA